jgi:hypothetical protein
LTSSMSDERGILRDEHSTTQTIRV